ncbi:protein of unknown function [Nitrospira japonica]|uniref:Response regulatory domain-containing protein n=1 Tax=Nitrospira japonica TaxID=1325564 RepID=A0A1W1I8B8_9BACT|nr:protein of unknown function [Nitrospira japonica]
MGPDPASLTPSPRVPRLLIVENNFSRAEPLMSTIGDRRLDVDYDVCTTAFGAVRKLEATPCQLIISAAAMAESDDALLLKRAQAWRHACPLWSPRPAMSENLRDGPYSGAPSISSPFP